MDKDKTGAAGGSDRRRSGAALMGGVAAGALVAALGGWLLLGRLAPMPGGDAGPDAAVPVAGPVASGTGVVEPAADAPKAAPEQQAAQSATEDTPGTPAGAPAVGQPDAASETQAGAAAEAQAAGDASAEADAPAGGGVVPVFDTFRAAPDGSVTLAGRAAPGAEVEVLLDGAPVATARAGAGGAFALVFDVPPSGAARALTLRVAGPGGGALVSAQTLVIRPDLVAEAAGAVPAPALLADATGAQVLAPAPDPGLGGALVVDTIAHDSGAAVSVSGRGGAAGQVLRAYLDNREAGLADVAPDGSWRLLLPDVGPGRYLLRIDALDDAGTVVARAETSFDRAAPEVLAVAGEAVAGDAVAGDAVAAPMPVAPGGVPASGAGGAVVARQGEAADGPEPMPVPVPVPGAVPVSGAGSARLARLPGSAGAGAVDQGRGTSVAVPADGAAARPVAGAGAAGAAPAVPAVRQITVARGSSLWAIARETYGDGILYVRVFEANRAQIRDPDLIYPGQVFTLPE
ncbi:LysM peptidoglycan-binding domain-containing protein [Pontitalea aquivivens]|uniref:LysM peptidoglycan-binding domain-containing protein n=1 Tax=Pontitalea aquivivens TaxID=3388663 RepID=UPI003970602F